MIEEEILRISRYYTVLVSFIILFGGIFGHIVDILIFTSSRRFRNNPSAFYLTTESIVNCIHLLISFSSRIAINGFDNDLTQTSVLWCKIRYLFATSGTLLSLSIVCFAAINQYLSTSFQSYLKQLSTLKLAHYLTCIATITWGLHGILFLIFMNNQTRNGCAPVSSEFVIYVTYVYYLILTGFLPIIIMSIFAILAYYNVRSVLRSRIPIFRRRIDRQLTAMIIVRVAFCVAVTLPYVIHRIYTIKSQISQKDSLSRAITDLIGSIAISLFFLNYSGSFYLFLISSARFRRQVRYVLVKKYWRMFCNKTVHGNRISPISHISSVEMD